MGQILVHSIVPHCTGSTQHGMVSRSFPPHPHALSIQASPWLLGHLSWVPITSMDTLLPWSNHFVPASCSIVCNHVHLLLPRSLTLNLGLCDWSVSDFPPWGSRILCACWLLSCMVSCFANQESEEVQPWLGLSYHEKKDYALRERSQETWFGRVRPCKGMLLGGVI